MESSLAVCTELLPRTLHGHDRGISTVYSLLKHLHAGMKSTCVSSILQTTELRTINSSTPQRKDTTFLFFCFKEVISHRILTCRRGAALWKLVVNLLFTLEICSLRQHLSTTAVSFKASQLEAENWKMSKFPWFVPILQPNNRYVLESFHYP